MPLKTGGLEEAGMNMIPMIDVLFLLVIFFMVSADFRQAEREFDVKLPSASAAQPLTNPPDEIIINVFRDGRILLGDQPCNLKQLQARLEQARDRYADQAVLIRGEGQGRYQQVVDVLVTCYRAKIKNFALATELKSERTEN